MRAAVLTKSICLALLAAAATAPAATARTTATAKGADGGAAAAPAPGEPAPSKGSSAAAAGGREYGEDDPSTTLTVPGAIAKVVDGMAYAPADAPDAVKQVIWAGNRIVGRPYRYGGGHGSFADTGYDCSGTVSFALHGASLLAAPRDSTGFYRFGQSGAGQWISIFTKSSHAYMTVAGVRLDTSAADDPAGGKGARWRPLRPSDAGFRVRHPVGL